MEEFPECFPDWVNQAELQSGATYHARKFGARGTF